MPDETYVRERIERGLPGAVVEVVDTTGTGDHFSAVVVAAQFRGCSRVDQHRLVYAALEGDLGDHSVHALQLTTRVPADDG